MNTNTLRKVLDRMHRQENVEIWETDLAEGEVEKTLKGLFLGLGPFASPTSKNGVILAILVGHHEREAFAFEIDIDTCNQLARASPRLGDLISIRVRRERGPDGRWGFRTDLALARGAGGFPIH